MTQFSRRPVLGLLAGLTLMPKLALGQTPLRIEINEGVIEPVPFAIPDFVPENGAGGQYAQSLARVIANNLSGTGLLREIPPSAHVGRITSFDSPVQFSDWRAINARALITGAVRVNGSQITVKFRLFDVVSGQQLGDGLQLDGSTDAWRRMAHRVSDQVYQRLTGESGYFDSRVVFVAESGPKDNRAKRLAVMDYDGANLKYLTDSGSIVLAPRFSPSGDSV